MRKTGPANVLGAFTENKHVVFRPIFNSLSSVDYISENKSAYLQPLIFAAMSTIYTLIVLNGIIFV